MKENQHTEFKESWHDEYPRYISALYLTFSHERINELSDMEREVYRILREEPTIRQIDLANRLDLTEQYIRKLIKKLKEHGWIERIGAKKNGYWKIIEKP